jgi:hypothetical protein
VDLDDRQRRTLVALACKVAWADGVVAEEERAGVIALVQRLCGDQVNAAELDAWLATGAPPAELADLPEAIGEMFIYEAMKLIESDGDVADAELALIDSLLSRVAKKHDPKTPLARVALVKRRA